MREVCRYHGCMMLTPREAYAAMFRYLEQYYGRTQADDVGALLGDLQLNEEGEPFDSAVRQDWIEAINWVKQNPETP